MKTIDVDININELDLHPVTDGEYSIEELKEFARQGKLFIKVPDDESFDEKE